MLWNYWQNVSNKILSLSIKTLDLLKQKYPEPMGSSPQTLLQGLVRPIHLVAYGAINESLVMGAAVLKKGDSGPTDLYAHGWQKILYSR